MTRKLALRRDVLRELSAGELSGVVAGGAEISQLDFVTCQLPFCLLSLQGC